MSVMKQRGDTIIEVLFAFTVFSLVAVGALTVMGQGVNAAQRALEITLVRQQIDAQAEALRYINTAYVASVGSNTALSPVAAQWSTITSKSFTDPSQVASFAADVTELCPEVPSRSYILDAHMATVASFAPNSISVRPPSAVTPPPYSQVNYNTSGQAVSADGIWIQSVRHTPSANESGSGYIDFHINACWENPGSGRASTIGTIVRLYEPR